MDITEIIITVDLRYKKKHSKVNRIKSVCHMQLTVDRLDRLPASTCNSNYTTKVTSFWLTNYYCTENSSCDTPLLTNCCTVPALITITSY